LKNLKKYDIIFIEKLRKNKKLNRELDPITSRKV